MVDNYLINELIEKETGRVFSGNQKFELKLTIDVFYKTLIFPLAKPELRLDGLENRVPNALNKVLNEGMRKIDNLAYFIEFSKIEQYLRKLLFLINPTKFAELEMKKSGLAAFINALNLNPNKINFEKDKIEDLYNDSFYGEHLYRTYNLRNVESHQCESWTNRELYQNIESVLVVYLIATHKYLQKLIDIVEINSTQKNYDFSIYLTSVKANFINRIGRFVDVKGVEDLSFSQSFVIEKNNDQESDRIERKGAVNELRKNQVVENRMLIWGDAGMGKSTTLEYLAYIDALDISTNPSSNIPVYIPLGLLTDKNISLKQSIFNRIGVDSDFGENLLKQGRLNLFLDAINEIPKDDNNQLRTLRLREIDNLLNDYKKTFIIVSNRPQDNNIFNGIPVFLLQKMDSDQIALFVKKNVAGDNFLATIVLDEIKRDERLQKIIRTPLMLSRLLEIVKSHGEMPKSEGEIIEKFIFSLYRREQIEKKDANFDVKKVHRMLRFLGYESLEKKDTNSGMTEDEVLNYFISCKEKYSFNIDTSYILEVSTHLGILERREDMYTFAHQAYQDYYHSQEEKAILGI